MRLLLDTHAFLWFILNDPKLGAAARRLISDPDNIVAVSPASYWEIAIKISLGKYALRQPFQGFMEQQIAINRFLVMHILVSHADVLITLPWHHRDPFDRLLVAQAVAEQVPIVSIDPALDEYPITRLWWGSICWREEHGRWPDGSPLISAPREYSEKSTYMKCRQIPCHSQQASRG